MILVDEYKHSLKNADIEEYVDLLVFRPLAFLFVKAIYVTELTPNQITLLSMVVGVGSGICFGLGGRATMVAGGILLGIATVFDCADGQLARLKKNGTHFGRILDGVSDYVYTVAAFFGIAIGCRVEGMEVWVWWMFVGSAGLSYAIQAGLLDYYRNEYMARAGGRSGFLTDELEEVVEERAKLSGEKGRFVAKALLLVYIEYSKLQRRFGGRHDKRDVLPLAGKTRLDDLRIKLWGLNGTSTHVFVLMVCSIFGRLDVFLWYILGFGSIYSLALFVWEKAISAVGR